ncbi:MAG: imidazole glycerol phosphate synthase subunit HisH [Clostridia bacterium]|nr:imidazole glycerol phosphate synthase subunit HisH [Clostridia bacterium]MBP5460401.1 imidazole glycerol phosphate synthase subunit HisH [Clostridia bacterium]
MIAIIDYGMGNLFSLSSSLRSLGYDVEITADPDRLRAADKLFLPGVGAFRDAQERLFSTCLAEVIKELCAEGKPLMGICLGMQLLFEKSYEYGEYEGLGLIPGNVVPMEGYIAPDLKIPQIGWNALHFTGLSHPAFADTKEGEFVYFVHSYFATDCDPYVVATTEYSKELTAAVANGNVCGCQFHPEKSGEVGLRLLDAFCRQ